MESGHELRANLSGSWFRATELGNEFFTRSGVDTFYFFLIMAGIFLRVLTLMFVSDERCLQDDH